MVINTILNGVKVEWLVEADEFLSDTLRTHGIKSVKTSCNDGACGSCTVLIDGKPSLSCEYLSARIDGKSITTIEGVRKEADEVAKCLVAVGAEGCGYCAPGFVITVIAMKRELDNPSYDEVRSYLNGNLCRCTGYIPRNEAAQVYMKIK